MPGNRDQDCVGGPAAVFPPHLERTAAMPRLPHLNDVVS
ncbi:predicted protein [Streptomyces viridosporus ATCC 14672]|uniref:Predicted protein n=1 Tax=Streptomyces viridosporus (strain ATCC 14672 / DSM 40746 / JCM 4963 / KCTC 9882 / NRRL B-12104 / FH 1290) TaxID=566461 RepID=D5ZVI1_STRV1|nr:predicted protein [Streptomyces viridosporus ATCC 14672]